MSNSLTNYLGLGKETSYADVATPTVFLPTKEVKGMGVEMDKKFVEAVIGTAPKNKTAFSGLAVMNAEYEMDLYPKSIGHIFNSAIGAPSSDEEPYETIVYRHIFTESFTKPSYTLEEKFGEIIKAYKGGIFKNFTLAGKKGETITLGFGGMAQNQANASESTPSYETVPLRPFNFVDVKTLTIGSVNILAHAEEFSFEYDNGLYARHAIGDNYLKGLLPGKSEHKGKFTLYLDNDSKAFLEDYIANTYRSIGMTIEGDAIGDASKNSAIMTVSKATITGVSEEISDNYNILELEWEAVEDPTNGIIKLELINEVASY